MFVSSSIMGKVILVIGGLIISGVVAIFKYFTTNRYQLMSIACLSGALFIACGDYFYTEKILWFFDHKVQTTLSPALISTLCSFFLVIPVFVRCKADIINNPTLINIILLLLDSLVVATFIRCFLDSDNIIPGIPVNGYTFLGVGILLSWVGIRPIAGYAWIALVIIALFRVVEVDQAMGIWGAAYLCLCILGILLQIKFICGDTYDIKRLFGNEFSGYSQVIRSDIYAAGANANQVLHNYTGWEMLDKQPVQK